MQLCTQSINVHIPSEIVVDINPQSFKTRNSLNCVFINREKLWLTFAGYVKARISII